MIIFMKSSIFKIPAIFLLVMILFGALGGDYARAQTPIDSCRLRAALSAGEARTLSAGKITLAQPQGTPYDLDDGINDGDQALLCTFAFVKWISTIFLVIIGAVALLMLGVGSFMFVTAGQSPTRAGRGRAFILWAVIGLVMAGIAGVIPTIALNIFS